MAQMPLDKTVPLGLLPLTIRSAWGPHTCFLMLVSPQPLPPLRADQHTERSEMGRPRATKSEGRGHRSDKPCPRTMKKTSCWTILAEQEADRKEKKLCLWTTIVKILWFFEGMGDARGILSYSTFWLKMRSRFWILWVSCFCTLAELSHRCRCYDIFPSDTRVNQGSKSRVKEHVRHGQHHPPHKIKPPRRKGETLISKNFQTSHLQITRWKKNNSKGAHKLGL